MQANTTKTRKARTRKAPSFFFLYFIHQWELNFKLWAVKSNNF